MQIKQKNILVTSSNGTCELFCYFDMGCKNHYVSIEQKLYLMWHLVPNKLNILDPSVSLKSVYSGQHKQLAKLYVFATNRQITCSFLQLAPKVVCFWSKEW